MLLTRLFVLVFSQAFYQKEVQIERISISSADSRQMGSLCTLGESVHIGRKDTGLRTLWTCLGCSGECNKTEAARSGGESKAVFFCR